VTTLAKRADLKWFFAARGSAFFITPYPSTILGWHGSSGIIRIRFMLETIAIVLILLWLLGIVSSYTMGGFIHILLVIAVIVVLVRLIQGRRV
jgi:hypothetical protein